MKDNNAINEVYGDEFEESKKKTIVYSHLIDESTDDTKGCDVNHQDGTIVVDPSDMSGLQVGEHGGRNVTKAKQKWIYSLMLQKLLI